MNYDKIHSTNNSFIYSIVLSLILDKIFMFEKSKDECKLIFTVMYILVVIILIK